MNWLRSDNGWVCGNYELRFRQSKWQALMHVNARYPKPLGTYPTLDEAKAACEARQ